MSAASESLGSAIERLSSHYVLLPKHCGCGHTAIAHDEHGCTLNISVDDRAYVRCHSGLIPDQPMRHQPASSFGYVYCAVCRADWPCHTAKEQA